MDLKSNINSLLEPLLVEFDLFLVELRIAGIKTQQKIVVLLDSDKGIGIDECTDVSRKLGNAIEEQALIPDKYTLEVSSPGVDFPLIFFRQYSRHVGRILEIKLNDGNALQGRLVNAENNIITIIEDKKRKKNEEIIPLIIPFADIKDTLVQVSFK